MIASHMIAYHAALYHPILYRLLPPILGLQTTAAIVASLPRPCFADFILYTLAIVTSSPRPCFAEWYSMAVRYSVIASLSYSIVLLRHSIVLLPRCHSFAHGAPFAPLQPWAALSCELIQRIRILCCTLPSPPAPFSRQFTSREATLAFVWSRMAVIDEDHPKTGVRTNCTCHII